jgi:hypothetical protein
MSIPKAGQATWRRARPSAHVFAGEPFRDVPENGLGASAFEARRLSPAMSA